MATARLTVGQHVETACVGALVGVVGLEIGWPLSALGGVLAASGIRGALRARKSADGRAP